MRLALALLLPAATATAQIVRLAPTADAWTNQDKPAANYGTDAELNFGKAFESQPMFRVWFTRGYIRFDLSSVSSVPDRARLFWYQKRSRAAGCLPVSLHRVTGAWSEASATWNNMPAHDSKQFATACVGDSFDLGWKTFDVTELVAGWLKSTWPNLGMVIKDPTERTAGAARPGYGHSRESTSAPLRPYLELSWGIAKYGAGCSPSRVLPDLDLAAGEPRPGSTYDLGATDLAYRAPALLFFGFSDKSWGGLTLPFDLSVIGHNGCKLLASGELLFAGTSDTRRNATFKIALPNDPRLRTLTFFHQLLSVDSRAAPVFYMTNGLKVTVF